jgi:hypothetical protein
VAEGWVEGVTVGTDVGINVGCDVKYFLRLTIAGLLDKSRKSPV